MRARFVPTHDTANRFAPIRSLSPVGPVRYDPSVGRNAKIAVVVVHTLVLAILHWPTAGLALAVLPCWGLALLAADEPRPTRAARHRDVQHAQRTTLGQILMKRNGWIIERPPVAIAVYLGVALVTVPLAVWLTPHAETPMQIAAAFVWAPAIVPALGFFVGRSLNIWALSFTLAALWLVSLIVFAVDGEGMQAARVASGGFLIVAAVFCADQLRGARRGLERLRKSNAS